jgi:hypothetical protein
MLGQDNQDGYGEGLDLGEAHILVEQMRDEAQHDLVEIVSGRGETETWNETVAETLPPMFKTFRSVFAEQLTMRMKLDSTPDVHTLLALKMHPAINTLVDGPQLKGKPAKAEIMKGEYVRELRRALIYHKAHLTAQPTTPAPPIPPPTAPPTPPPPTTAPPTAPPTTATAPPTAPPTAHDKPPTPTKPAVKKRKGLMGIVAAAQATPLTPLPADMSIIDVAVEKEIEAFDAISYQILGDPNNKWP